MVVEALLSLLLVSPGHQQPWYWLCRIGMLLSYMRKNFNYSELSIYCRIGYIAVPCWTPFLAHLFCEFCRRGTQEHDICRAIVVTPFSRETIFREICSPRKPLFPFAGVKFSRNQLKPTCQRGLEHMLCDGQPLHAEHWHLQTFLIESSLFDHAVYIRHLVQSLRQFHSKSSVRDW